MAAHTLKRGDPSNLRRRRGKLLHHGGDFSGIVVFGGQCAFLCYSYRTNPTGLEFFVSIGTLIAVKLLAA